jgi:WXG100 family type VII secretion target
MSQILVSPEELRGHAGVVQGHASEAATSFGELQRSLSSLQDSFQGRASVKFEEVYQTWNISAQELSAALEGLGRFLAGAADTVEGVDTELAAALGG